MELIIIACLGLGLIPAIIAHNKGRNFIGWWFFGFALFIVALPTALIVKPLNVNVDQRAIDMGGKKCPFCAEIIKREAIVCKHCGRDQLQEQPAAPPLLQQATLPEPRSISPREAVEAELARKRQLGEL